MLENIDAIVYNYLADVFNNEYGDNEYTEVQEENINDLLENVSYDVDSNDSLKDFKDEFVEGMKDI